MLLHRYRLGSWLAQCALAFQLVLSFGHIHLDGVHGTFPKAKARFTAHVQPLRAQQPGDDDDDGYCPICATIYLAANSFLPQPPTLPAQFASRPIERVDRAPSAVIVAARGPPFQSRAPPLA
jgi:hypothetical protein